ncbi:MAG: amylo-alpha-1,6-glucosidase [Cyanobacteria bacterium P01_F01_bin.150]
MEKLDTREWLLTNGLGSFASGTVGDAHTRTYHGWLIAALDSPSQRTVLLSHLEASLEINGIHTDLGTNFWGSGDVCPDGFRWLQSFYSAPLPTWIWARDHWTVSRELLLPHWTSTLVSEDALNWASNYSQANYSQSIGDDANLEQGDDGSWRPSIKYKKQARNNLTHIVPEEQLKCCHRVLVRYRYDGEQAATLTLRPLISDRHFHHQQRASSQLQFSQVVAHRQLLLQAIRPDWSGTPWYLRWTNGIYHPDSVWYWDYCYPEETRRGLGDAEDLYSPGYLRLVLQPGDSITLEATVGLPPSRAEADRQALTDTTFDELVQAECNRLHHHVLDPHWLSGNHQDALSLVPSHANPAEVLGCQIKIASPPANANAKTNASMGQNPESKISGTHSLQHIHQLLQYAGDQFIAYRSSVVGTTIMAGYPWFGDWGRDTLISMPGLTLTTRRYSLARGLLRTFGQHCEQGLIPNAFPDKGARPYYNSLDASLWWIETLGLYLDATQDWDFIEEQYPVVQHIYKSFMTGTLHNIRVDAVDSLLTWSSPNVALTWMDATVEDIPVTPRMGKAIEINALWYSSLCWMQKWASYLQSKADAVGDGPKANAFGRQVQRYKTQITQVRTSLNIFWNPQRGYFYDTIGPDDSPDPSIRPNAIIALSLSHCGFSQEHGQRALELAHSRLLTPYGLRSLDPANPAYVGSYAGNMPRRDRAYHQGTVWSWLLGPFIRSWKRFYGDRSIPFNPAPLMSHIVEQDGLGLVSEIFDGDAPHLSQGAISQAWSVAELLRHWSDLSTL